MTGATSNSLRTLEGIFCEELVDGVYTIAGPEVVRFRVASPSMAILDDRNVEMSCA